MDSLVVFFMLMAGVGNSQLANLDNNNWADVDRSSPIRSYNVRAGLEIPLSTTISLRPEFSYSNGGGLLVEDISQSYVRHETYSLQELRVPLLLQVGTSSRNATRAFMAIGGYAGFTFDARMREQLVATSTGVVIQETPWSAVDGLIPVNAGAVLEVGIRTRVIGLNVGADVRLSHGLTSIGSGSTYVVQRDLTFSLGIGIP